MHRVAKQNADPPQSVPRGLHSGSQGAESGPSEKKATLSCPASRFTRQVGVCYASIYTMNAHAFAHAPRVRLEKGLLQDRFWPQDSSSKQSCMCIDFPQAACACRACAPAHASDSGKIRKTCGAAWMQESGSQTPACRRLFANLTRGYVHCDG